MNPQRRVPVITISVVNWHLKMLLGVLDKHARTLEGLVTAGHLTSEKHIRNVCHGVHVQVNLLITLVCALRAAESGP